MDFAINSCISNYSDLLCWTGRLLIGYTKLCPLIRRQVAGHHGTDSTDGFVEAIFDSLSYIYKLSC